MSLDKLAVFGVNGCVPHLAGARQQGQLVDESLAAPAETGPQQFALAPVLPGRFDGRGERNRPMAGDRGTLFGLAQAGMVRRIGGLRRAGRETDQQAEYESGGYRHEAGSSA
jgi:hypothetical protein